MGGKVAMQLALNYPDHVNKLVVMDVSPIPKSGLSDLRYVLPALVKVDLSRLHSKRELDAALQDKVPVSPPPVTSLPLSRLFLVATTCFHKVFFFFYTKP